MNIAEIETELEDLVDKPFDAATFIFRFLEIYDAAKATVTKLKQGAGNHGTEPGDVLWKNKIFFRVARKGHAANVLEGMLAEPVVKKHNPRFVFSTDGEEVYCRDRKADLTIDPSFSELNDQFLFFLPLANIERYEAPSENPADIKATGRVARLYDAILEANADWIERDYTHDLNQFMTRLLFCFFAEDTSIFEKDIFTSTLMNLTQEDGSDTASTLDLIFEAMNKKRDERAGLPEYAKRFPYVNGGLFRDKTQVPKFSKRARRLLKECGELFWKDINPDIFGSMIQAVAQPGLREDMGMHYTSVPNIMKVLHPLFLLSLEEEFHAAKDNEAKLTRLLQRIYNIRIFDPACGSGNFLIIAYKELRRLEMRIFEREKEIAKQWSLPMTGVTLAQFFGIELTDFATETAKLSLWIAEYQMNELFKSTFGKAPPALPLRDGGNIVHGNATRLPWLTVCPHQQGTEVYIVGNPPYRGGKVQSAEQKDDVRNLFSQHTKTFKTLDYVACWYFLAAQYCRTVNARAALVATNSICQGEQVSMLWPLIQQLEVEPYFAYQSFKWRNSAASNAGVSCIIAGLRPVQPGNKFLYAGEHRRQVRNIGPYLIEMDNVIVEKRTRSISDAIPKISLGNMAKDGGNLIMSAHEKNELLSHSPQAAQFVRRLYGSQEFIQGIERYCLWIEDHKVGEATAIPEIASRIEKTRQMRIESDAPSTQEYAKYPYRFRQIQDFGHEALIIPRVSSEDRRYIPVGFVDDKCIVSDLAYAVYGASPYLLSILSSRLHAVWILAVCGQLETRIRYSNQLGYNTFPVPKLSADQIAALEDHAVDILGAREAHPGKTIAFLYDSETMPPNVAEAHDALDETLETIYIGRLFRSDTDRLEHLFKMYSGMVKKERAGKLKGEAA